LHQAALLHTGGASGSGTDHLAADAAFAEQSSEKVDVAFDASENGRVVLVDVYDARVRPHDKKIE
jgi:hypothetical protein